MASGVSPASLYAALRNDGPAFWAEFGHDGAWVGALEAVATPDRLSWAALARSALAGGARAGNARVPTLLGWLSYEAGAWFERMPIRAPGPLPLAWWGRVRRAVRFDARGRPHDPRLRWSDAPPPVPRRTRGARLPGEDRQVYERGVRRILAHLRAGDCYQVNLARTIRVRDPGDPLDAWLRLRARNPSRRGMIVETPWGAVVSNSPELLLRARGRRLLSVPIKGTRPADVPRALLLGHPKERAELTMIVDLIRSELGRVAAPGSVRAGPRRVGRVGHVQHAMQRVEAQLDVGRDAVDAVAALFPPGSVTGAPKVRAMEVIAELEPESRGLYCGSLGFFGRDAASMNVAIRTISFVDGEARVQVGAGIVIGSDPAREFEETELKAARLLEALC